MPYISDAELDRIPSDPIDGIRYICSLVNNFCESTDRQGDPYAEYAVAIELHQLVATYIEAHGLPFAWEPLPKDPRFAPSALCGARNTLKEEVELQITARIGEISRSRFVARFSSTDAYTLTDGDIAEINRLIGELRNSISVSQELEPKHKQRVLHRLESLQREVHKRVSDFDRVVGTICDVLVVAKKVGEAAEP